MTFFENFNIKKIIVPAIIIILLIIGIILILIGNKQGSNISYDNKKVYIDLLGDKEITIYVGSEYIEPGYRVTSSNGENLTDKAIVDSNVDTNNIGNYTIKYIYNNDSAIRKVKVVEKPVGATYIFLYGEMIMYLNVNEEYIEPGYEVVDSVDGGKLKNQVKIDSNLNPKKGGVYKITYSVVNSSGITTSKQRTVIVMDSEISLTLDNEEYTNGDVTINFHVNDPHYAYAILPDNSKITEYTYSYKASENGLYTFTVYNQKGNYKESTITVNNINKTLPTGSCSGSYQNGKSTININATDDIGIAKYVINNSTYTNNQIVINGEHQSVLVTVYDKAGNNVIVSCSLVDYNSVESPTPSPTPKEDKTKLNVTAGMHRMTNKDFIYYVYFPPGATINMPIILWLHGDFPREEWTADNQVGRLAYEAGHPAILVAPFGGDDFGYASNPGWYEGGLLPKVKSLLDEVCNKYKCDKSNINVGGHSRGAIGTWQIVNKYPGYFHAASPISCCSSGLIGENFSGIKLWAMRGSGRGTGYNNDDRYSCMQANVNTVKNYVKAYRYVIKPNKTHGDMANSFDQEYFDFMFSK